VTSRDQAGRAVKTIAWLAWGGTVALVALAFATWGDACGSDAPFPWLSIGSGVLAAAATFASIRTRRALAVLAALLVGAVVGGGMLLIGLLHWVGSCTA
jgi:hypothetical protein